MSRGPKATVELTLKQRAILEKWTRARSFPARVVKRARIVLRTASGEPDKEIARAMGTTPWWVSQWCKRFLALGPPGLEKNAPYPPRKPGLRQDPVVVFTGSVLFLTGEVSDVHGAWQRLHGSLA
jgi:hypothetical protein